MPGEDLLYNISGKITNFDKFDNKFSCRQKPIIAINTAQVIPVYQQPLAPCLVI